MKYTVILKPHTLLSIFQHKNFINYNFLAQMLAYYEYDDLILDQSPSILALSLKRCHFNFYLSKEKIKLYLIYIGPDHYANFNDLTDKLYDPNYWYVNKINFLNRQDVTLFKLKFGSHINKIKKI